MLYHFTARELLPGIARDGLSRGQVPLSPRQAINAVWLTTDGDPSGHGLADGVGLPEHLIAIARRLNEDPSSVVTLNKRAIRFAVKLRSRDPDLVHWPRWSKRVLAPDWYEALNRAGGGKAPTWYLYFGVIAPGLIEPIDVATATPLDGWPEAFVSLPVAPEGG
jgi:hypothetical protein